MPTKKPRVTVTLEPRAHEILTRLSEASGETITSLIVGHLDLALPTLERLVAVLERAKAAPEEARAGLSAAIQRAERDLIPPLIAAIGQGDMFLQDLSEPPEAAAAERRRAAAAPSDPRPSNTGVRSGGKGRKGAGRGSV